MGKFQLGYDSGAPIPPPARTWPGLLTNDYSQGRGGDQEEIIKSPTVVTGLKSSGSNSVPTAAGGKRRTLRTKWAPNGAPATDMGLYFRGVCALRAWL